MTEPILRLKAVTAGYGAMIILRDLSLDIRAGRITTLLGPNGAGKSTVFKAVFGLLPLAAGAIEFAGASIQGLKPRNLLERGIAYVPQGRNLFPELSVLENLELGGTILADRATLRRRLDEVMDHLPVLRAKRDAQASTLSGGEQKMLEIGRALLLTPKLILIDEPSIGLAPALVSGLFARLRALRAAGITVVMIEQNARSALAISDDALVLEQGRLRLSGSAAAILADPRVGSLFLGGGVDTTEDGAGGARVR